MKVRFLTWVLLAVSAATGGGRCEAAVAVGTLSLNDAVGDPHATTVASGQSFTVTVQLAAAQSFKGYSIALTDPGYVGTARFTLTKRLRLATNPFVDATKPDATFDNDPVDDKTRDLGYTFDGTAGGVGSFDLMTLTIVPAADLSPGTYPIRFSADSVLTSVAFTDLGYDGLGGYNVTISDTPEPAVLGVVGAAVTLLTRRPKSAGTRGMPR